MNAPTSIVLSATIGLASILLGCSGSVQTDSDHIGDHTGKGKETGLALAEVAPEVQAELAQLEGKWTGVSLQIDGLDRPVGEWYRYTFDGDRMTTETNRGGRATVRFHLDPNTSPKQLDTSIIVDGVEEISKGIYAIDGDTLKLTWRVGGERPSDFQSRDRDEKIVLILRRAKD